MKVARAHTMPLADYEKYCNVREGTVIWQNSNNRIVAVHLPNWLGRDPLNAPPLLAFMSILGRTYMGVYLSLEQAMGVFMI